jgi:ankyrin repeat protein
MIFYSPSVKNPYTLTLHVLVIGLLLVLGSCNCKGPKLPAKQETIAQKGPAPAHLLLSSSKSNLEDKETNFEISIKNEEETIANLHEYALKITLQEQGGVGSILHYQDATNTSQHIKSIKQPLSHFIKQKTLKKSDPTLTIPFRVEPLPSVKKVVITFTLEHQDKKDNVSPIAVSWKYLSPITKEMIQLARNQGYDFLADALIHFQAGEVININKLMPNDTGLTALHRAAMLGNVDIFDCLLKIGADMEIKDLFGTTPLHLAARYGHLSIIQKLIENGANLNAKTKANNTPLIIATQYNEAEVAKALIHKLTPEQLNESNADGKTALYWAIQNKQAEVANALIQKLTPEQLNERNANGETALYWASKNKRKEITDELLKKLDLSKVQEKNDQDGEILTWAIVNDHTSLALAVINNSNQSQLITPYNPHNPSSSLHWAFFMDKETICLKLIEKLDVAQLNTQDQTMKYTPLHWAVIHNNLTIIRSLINKGVDKNIINKEGKKAFELAKTQEIKALLTSP